VKYDINLILIGVLAIAFVGFITIWYIRTRGVKQRVDMDTFPTFDSLLEAVRASIVDLVREDYGNGVKDTEWDKLYARKARINQALKNCVYGVESSKNLVISLIHDFIEARVPEDRVLGLLGLSPGMEPSIHFKWEIILYKYKRIHGKNAVLRLVDDRGWLSERAAREAGGGGLKQYYVSVEDLENCYQDMNIELTYEEQLDILARLVFQRYKGFGVLDTLLEMNINGCNVGTSGAVLDLDAVAKDPEKSVHAVWLYDRGRYVHLAFMNFQSEGELRRIIQLIVRYGSPGPLTAKRGYIVNNMHDKSRVMAMRPPVSEHWACFVRKFTLSDESLEYVIQKPGMTNTEIPMELIKYAMRGEVTTCFSGRQGSGKTTLMRAVVKYIDPRYNIRVLEMAPELYLREIYKTRNILSAQETPTVSATQVQDAFKKSDGAVSMVGEVATDAVALNMIQFAMTGSIFTAFTHHANTAKDLVLTLRNSICAAGNFSNMSVAEKQVIDAVRLDFHLDYGADGDRYVERLTEIIPLEEGTEYPEVYSPDFDAIDPSDPNAASIAAIEYYKNQESLARIQAENAYRVTDRVMFETQDIMRYDKATKTYNPVKRFTIETENHIKQRLGTDVSKLFEAFMLKWWGPREGTPEADLSKEELEQLIAELTKDGESAIFDADVVTSGVAAADTLYGVTDNSYIESEFMEQWKQGYIDGAVGEELFAESQSSINSLFE
jgi:pilus assembly protein CpaF